MKILQINASYKPAYIYGGPTMSVSKLSEQLIKVGVEITVFTTTANGITELPVVSGRNSNIDGVPVTYFKRWTKDHTHFSPSLLKKLWKEVKTFDLVHIHAWWNLVSILSCWVAIKRRVPVVVSPRGTLSSYSFSNKNNLSKRIIHRLLGKGLLNNSCIHVTSDREKQAIEHIISPKQIITIPNFVVLSGRISNEKQDSSNSKSLKLLFFSRIEEKKGLDILLNALTKVIIPYHLTVAGDGNSDYINKLKAIAANNGIADRISWIGFQRAGKFQLLQQHDLMILPSHDENFGNVVIESLSVGTPVLISNNVGLAGYVETKGLGWICEANQEEISMHINRLFGEETKRSEIRHTAPDTIRIDFDEATLTERYITMYRGIIDND